MFCSKCGRRVPYDASFCHICGENLERLRKLDDSLENPSGQAIENAQTENVQTENAQTENAQTENAQTENAQSANYQSANTQGDSGQQTYSQPTYQYSYTQHTYSKPKLGECYLPMKWYKFSICFLWVAEAVLCFVYSFIYFTGISYGEHATAVYKLLPSLKTADIVSGVVYLIYAILALAVHSALKNRERSSKNRILAVYLTRFICGIIVWRCYEAVPKIIYRIDTTTVIIGIAGNLLLMVLEYIYYTKRDNYFIY